MLERARSSTKDRCMLYAILLIPSYAVPSSESTTSLNFASCSLS